MNNNRIEFIIEKDSSGVDISMSNMPLDAAKSMIVFLESLTKMANLQLRNSDFRIGVSEGSTVVSITTTTAPHFDSLETEFMNVLEHESINKAYVHPLRDIQSTIQANGLQYQVNIVKNGHKTPVLDRFKNSRKFSVKTRRTRPDYQLVFIKGKLIEIGGKFPNFHIDTNEEPVKIDCTEQEAIKIKDLLYANIYIAAWRKRTSKEKLQFCTFYTREEEIDSVKEFILNNTQAEGTSKYSQIHSAVVRLVEQNNLYKVQKFIQLFNHPSVDNGKLRTILITLKAFKENEILKPTLDQIADILREKSKRKTI